MPKQATARKAEAAEISARSQARARPHDSAVAGEAAAVWVDPRTLVRNPKNPRRNDAAVPGVARSIQENGFGAPIVARLANRMIIAGDTRWRASVEVLELPLVPVRFLDVTQKQAEVLTVGDNKLGELAEWDDQKLADLLQEMEPAEQLLAGFAPDDIGDLLAQVATTDELPDLNAPDPTHHQITFVLSARQLAQVEAALAQAKAHGLQVVDNENSNGNALAAVCEAYCGQGETVAS